MIEAYKSSRLEKAEATGLPEVSQNLAQRDQDKREWGAKWLDQFSILMVRGLKEGRHEYFSWHRFIHIFMVALMSGCLWWQSKINTEKQLVGQVFTLFTTLSFSSDRKSAYHILVIYFL